MWNSTRMMCTGFVVLALGLAAHGSVEAAQSGQTVKGGMEVHYSIVPAEAIAAYPDKSPERLMHGGPPRGAGQNHVMVALYDAKTHQRIDDADVSATVGELAMAGQAKRLESMVMAGNVTYGNYFRLTGHGPYRVVLRIRRAGVPGATVTSFDYAP